MTSAEWDHSLVAGRDPCIMRVTDVISAGCCGGKPMDFSVETFRNLRERSVGESKRTDLEQEAGYSPNSTTSRACTLWTPAGHRLCLVDTNVLLT